jgi:hypothetical protein
MRKAAAAELLSRGYVIDVSKPFHVAWWAATLGVNQADLVRAVRAVGAEVDEVYRYFSRQMRHVSDDEVSAVDKAKAVAERD